MMSLRHGAAGFAIGLALAAPAMAAPAARLPFSEAVRAGDMLYLSGQIGMVPGATQPVAGGLPAEARQAMANIGATLRRNGLGFGDVVKCLVMLTDMRRWGEFNEVYIAAFPPGPLPARSAFGAAALAFGAQVEVECTARIPSPAPRAVNASAALGAYSQAVAANGLLFVSGVIPFDSASQRFAERDIPAQMAQALANLDTVLAASGARRGDIVRTTLYLRRPGDRPAADAAYAAWFAGLTLPARTTVPGIDWGRDDLLVEIDAIAVVPGASQ